MKKVLAVLAFAGLASSAMAQSFEARIAFRDDHTASATPDATSFEVNAAHDGTVEMSALFGAFNASGFTNRGMFNFIGAIQVNDPAGAATLGYRVAGTPGSGLRTPYSFGQVESFVGPAGTFDANRGDGSVNGLIWNFGSPAPADSYTYPAFSTSPPPGVGGAPDAYFPGERFVVDLNGNRTMRTITVTVSGNMQAISGWFATTSVPPEDEETPGFQNLLPAGFVSSQGSATFTITVVPAPGAAALLGLGGLVAARRRRA